MAALMSALIGVNWPINSVGVLPDVDPTKPGYLLAKDGEKTQAEAALVNAKVVLEHYRVKHGRSSSLVNGLLAHQIYSREENVFAVLSSLLVFQAL